MSGTERLAAPFLTHGGRTMGELLRTHGVPLYADSRHYAARGIPTVMFGAGPRDILEANAHRADERLRLSDLYKATEVVACAVADLLQPGQDPAAGFEGRSRESA